VFVLDLASGMLSRSHVIVCKMRRYCVTSGVLSVVLLKFQVFWVIHFVR